MKNNRLKQELRQSNAPEKELDELLEIAQLLKQSPQPTLSQATREKIKAIPNKTPGRRWPAITAWSLAGSMAVFIALVIGAQYATPGSPLYALKKSTEQIRALIQPSYKETIVEIRKQELETLEEQDASDAAIEKATESYEKALERSQDTQSSSESKQRNETERRFESSENNDWRSRDRDSRRDTYQNDNTRSERFQNGYWHR